MLGPICVADFDAPLRRGLAIGLLHHRTPGCLDDARPKGSIYVYGAPLRVAEDTECCRDDAIVVVDAFGPEAGHGCPEHPEVNRPKDRVEEQEKQGGPAERLHHPANHKESVYRRKACPRDTEDPGSECCWDVSLASDGLKGLIKVLADDVIDFGLRGAACQFFSELLGGILGICRASFEKAQVYLGIRDHVRQVAKSFSDRCDDAWVQVSILDALL